MATNDQLQQILEMMRQQMEQLQNLETENAAFRANQANNVPPNTTKRPKTKAPDRPIINVNTDEQKWKLFKDSWSRYKTMTNINNPGALRMELHAACSQKM